MKHNQHRQDTLVHIVLILNVIRYAAQVNMHSINVVMDKVDETSQGVTTYTTWLPH